MVNSCRFNAANSTIVIVYLEQYASFSDVPHDGLLDYNQQISWNRITIFIHPIDITRSLCVNPIVPN